VRPRRPLRRRDEDGQRREDRDENETAQREVHPGAHARPPAPARWRAARWGRILSARPACRQGTFACCYLIYAASRRRATSIRSSCRCRRGDYDGSVHDLNRTPVSAAAAAAPSVPAPVWEPLSHPLFRALWLAALASNVGTWMQDVGATWLMTSLT